MKKVLRLLFFCLLCFWVASDISAGQGSAEPKTLLFLRNHVSIESGVSLLRVRPLSENGQGSMRLSHRPGMYLGVKYHINLNDHFALRIGPNVGLHAFRFDFDPGFTDTVTYASAKMSVVKPYLALPMEMNARFMVQQRHVVGVVAGISVNLFASEKLTAATSLSGNPKGQEIYKMELVYGRPNPFVNFETGIEYFWVLRDLDMIKFAVKYSIGLRPVFHAQYEHSDNDFVLSSGSFNSFNDHLSIGVGYVFTRVNKLLDN